MPRSVAEEFTRCAEFTLPSRVHYRGRSALAGPLAYAALVTLAGTLGGRMNTAAFARTVGCRPQPQSVARVCAESSRTLKRLGCPGCVRVAGGDVAIEPSC